MTRYDTPRRLSGGADASQGTEAVSDTREGNQNECECPAWVVRCLHYQGRIIFVHIWDIDPSRNIWFLCHSSPISADILHGHDEIKNYGSDRSAAFAAFEAEEARILREVFGR